MRDRVVDLSAPVGVGIVNVTEDSFFAGARSGTSEGAVADGRRLAAEGFDLLDVGAVPARPAPAVAAQEESARLVPAIEELAGEIAVTADTSSPEVAGAALAAGALAINDIGGAADPAMLELAAETGCGLVIMHIDGPPRRDRAPAAREDPVKDLKDWFGRRIDEAASQGVAREQLALDPGFDFDLSADDGLEVLRRLDELNELGRPLFVSLSRKDFLGAAVAGSWERRLPAEEREWATVAAAALASAASAQLLRLHDRSALDAIRVAHRISHG